MLTVWLLPGIHMQIRKFSKKYRLTESGVGDITRNLALPEYVVIVFIIGRNLVANFLDENLQNPRCRFASLWLIV